MLLHHCYSFKLICSDVSLYFVNFLCVSVFIQYFHFLHIYSLHVLIKHIPCIRFFFGILFSNFLGSLSLLVLSKYSYHLLSFDHIQLLPITELFLFLFNEIHIHRIHFMKTLSYIWNINLTDLFRFSTLDFALYYSTSDIQLLLLFYY